MAHLAIGINLCISHNAQAVPTLKTY